MISLSRVFYRWFQCCFTTYLLIREALGRAFGILGYDPELQDYIIQFHDFVLFMAQYKPRIRQYLTMCSI